jgi:polar amino acid transport system substrate-binding protein
MQLTNFLMSVLALALSASASAKTKLNLALVVQPPYIYQDDNNQFKGEAVDKVAQILQAMDVPYQFVEVDYHSEASSLVEKGRVDGFMLGVANGNSKNQLLASTPLYQSEWAWFYLTDSKFMPGDAGFKVNGRIGVTRNSYSYEWLVANQYQVTAISNQPATLIKMLKHNQLDAVFMTSTMFWQEFQKIRNHEANVQQQTVVINPYTVNFSKRYLDKNPYFLARFNQQLAQLQ